MIEKTWFCDRQRTACSSSCSNACELLSAEEGPIAAPTLTQMASLRRWRFSTLMVVLVGYVGYYLCRGNISAALPLLGSTFGYSNMELGLILTVSEICYAVGKMVNGPLADKIGGRKIFLLGMIGAILFNLLFTMASTILTFTIIWGIARFFLSMGWGGILKMVGAWYEPERNGTIMGIVSINFQLGGGIAFLYCGFLVSLGVTWQGLFWIPALTLAVIALFSAIAAKENPQKLIPDIDFPPKIFAPSHARGDFRDKKAADIARTLLRIPVFHYLLLFSFFTTFLRSIFVFWTTKFLADIGMGASSAMMNSALFPFLGIVGSLFLGWYTDRYAIQGNRAKAMWITLTGLVVCLLGIAMLVPYRMEFQFVIVSLLGACGFFLLGPYSMASGCLTLDIAGAEASGTAAGMIDGVGYLGGALAAWSAGVISYYLGWQHVFFMLSGMAALATLVTYKMSGAYKRMHASGSTTAPVTAAATSEA